MFREVRRNRVFEDVVAQIEEAIFRGRLKAGDVLPSERDLRRMFKVSRTSLREALRVLEQKGLIEIKVGVGGGALVKNANTDQAVESLGFLIRFKAVSLENLYEFRVGIEGDIAAIAAKKATKQEIQELKMLLADWQKLVEDGVDRFDTFLLFDKKMHLTMARITQNPLYFLILQTIHSNIQTFYEDFLPKEEDVIKENYESHCGIISAVEKGQIQKARSLAQDHVLRNCNYLRKTRKYELESHAYAVSKA